ncbi:MAG: TraB/GumN family protein [Saprospiraceae bacterium]|nr:TraB/GumN family protein [Saprospiraceae bacterium]
MPQHHALLWQIIPPIAPSQPSYLFGTMHVKDARAFHLQTLVQECISEVEQVAIEFDLDDTYVVQAMQYLYLPKGETLTHLLSHKKYQKVRKRILIHSDFDIEQFQQMRPIVLQNMITDSLLQKDKTLRLDEHIWAFAKQQGKELTGIESYAEQLQAIAKIPIDYQLKSLLSFAFHFRSHYRQMNKMAEAYLKSDIQQLYKSARKSSGILRKPLIFDRNKIMAERIAQMILEKPSFCAIGAAHLAGGKGVLRLLKHYGFHLKPIKDKR